MGVGEQTPEHFGVTVFSAPELRPAEEETLIAAPTIKDRSRLALKGEVVRFVGDR